MSRKKTQITDLNLSKIGGRVAYLRLSRGLTQDQFSKLTGFSKGNVSGLESHKYEPSARAIVKLVELFDVTADWILFGDKTPEKKSSPNNVINVVTEHQDLVKRFKNPKKAKQFNEFLVGVEKHNPKGYDNLYELAKSLYESTSEGRNKKKAFSTKKNRASGD
ncbi:MAG: helix-turn-helix domain-containing protein [Desulfobacterales bacterium]|nr:helix-turn-helix domain-containing protein [Desulfobacterales bacterium]